ncbi:MAG: ATP-binding protein [Candidatus Omnitrophota bacterium]
MLNEPAVGSTFFGRKDVLSILGKRVNALRGGYRQNVALTGQMLSGKSSILYQFLYLLKDTSLVPLYIEVMEEPFSLFADKFIATLLYNYLVSCDRKVDKDLNALIKESEALIPHTVYAIKRVKSDLAKRKYSYAYRELLNLTSILNKETGKSCIVILDEFHNLEFFRIKKPYIHFGKIIMIQKDTMYIVSSSQKSAIKKILSEKLALLYGNFEIVEVSGFDWKTSHAFLREKMQNITLPQRYADYIIDFADKTPFYLDVISKKILEIANAQKFTYVDEGVMVEAFTSLLHNTSGTINQYFTNNIMNLLEKRGRKDFLDVLIAMACGANKLKGIAGWLNKKSTGGFTGKLVELEEFDMVYKNGSFYELQDKVFKFWLRTVYHARRTALVDDMFDKANDFRQEIKKDIDGYLFESQKNLIERVKELFSSFNGETVEIDKRQKKLSRFESVDFADPGQCQDLIAKQERTGKLWVSCIAMKKIEEPDVADLIERYRHMRDKIGRQIYIALGGIDENALLLAKEKSVWVWDPANVNELLKLYKKYNMAYE